MTILSIHPAIHRADIEATYEPDRIDWFEVHATAYEASAQFVVDAIDHLTERGDLPSELVDMACDLYRGSRRYATVVDDAACGEVMW